MSSVIGKASLEQLAALVCQTLADEGIDAVLVGGAVVSIYSNNEYMSRDLDFITHAESKRVNAAMEKIGFKRSPGRHFTHGSHQTNQRVVRAGRDDGEVPSFRGRG